MFNGKLVFGSQLKSQEHSVSAQSDCMSQEMHTDLNELIEQTPVFRDESLEETAFEIKEKLAFLEKITQKIANKCNLKKKNISSVFAKTVRDRTKETKSKFNALNIVLDEFEAVAGEIAKKRREQRKLIQDIAAIDLETKKMLIEAETKADSPKDKIRKTIFID